MPTGAPPALSDTHLGALRAAARHLMDAIAAPLPEHTLNVKGVAATATLTWRFDGPGQIRIETELRTALRDGESSEHIHFGLIDDGPAAQALSRAALAVAPALDLTAPSAVSPTRLLVRPGLAVFDGPFTAPVLHDPDADPSPFALSSLFPLDVAAQLAHAAAHLEDGHGIVLLPGGGGWSSAHERADSERHLAAAGLTLADIPADLNKPLFGARPSARLTRRGALGLVTESERDGTERLTCILPRPLGAHTGARSAAAPA